MPIVEQHFDQAPGGIVEETRSQQTPSLLIIEQQQNYNPHSHINANHINTHIARCHIKHNKTHSDINANHT